MKPTHHQTHVAGRHLAVAEALLLGYDAKLIGSRTYIEVNGHKAQVQVAAKGAWMIENVDKYTSATIGYVVLVDVTDGQRKFYVAPGDRLRSDVRRRHDAFLASKGGTRPRNPDSKNAVIYPAHVQQWRDGWGALK